MSVTACSLAFSNQCSHSRVNGYNLYLIKCKTLRTGERRTARQSVVEKNTGGKKSLLLCWISLYMSCLPRQASPEAGGCEDGQIAPEAPKMSEFKLQSVISSVVWSYLEHGWPKMWLTELLCLLLVWIIHSHCHTDIPIHWLDILLRYKYFQSGKQEILSVSLSFLKTVTASIFTKGASSKSSWEAHVMKAWGMDLKTYLHQNK